MKKIKVIRLKYFYPISISNEKRKNTCFFLYQNLTIQSHVLTRRRYAFVI